MSEGISHQSWLRQRRYLHFDTPLKKDKVIELVENPARVASHAFFPLISSQTQTSKLVEENGQLRRTGKERQISFAGHLDSHIYSYYEQKVSLRYESVLQDKGLGDSILAFRKLGKSNVEFARDAFLKIKETGSCTVVAMDIKSFFDELDHSYLKNKLCEVLGEARLPADYFNIFKSVTRFSWVDQARLYKALGYSINNKPKGIYRLCSSQEFRDKVRTGGLIETNSSGRGIPQGATISSVLANLYMLDFDRAMHSYAAAHNGFYYRYCDDILLVLAGSLEPSELEAKIQEEVGHTKLTINPSKTRHHLFYLQDGLLNTDKPLQYLGFDFDGENVYLRSSSLTRYYARVKRGVSLARQTMRKYNRIRDNKGLATQNLYKNKLYARYTHFGTRNFITYGLRAAEIMDSDTIREQLKPHWKRLQKEIDASEVYEIILIP